MKQSSAVLKVALMLLALPLPAVAQKPTIQVFPFTSFFIPAAGGCGFDVLLTPEPGRPNGERLIEFANITMLQGPLFVTVTNLSTGKTIDLNGSGPAQAQPSVFSISGTVVTFGPEIIGVLPANVAAAAGLPLLPYIHGRAVFIYDAEGNITSASFIGKVDDLVSYCNSRSRQLAFHIDESRRRYTTKHVENGRVTGGDVAMLAGLHDPTPDVNLPPWRRFFRCSLAASNFRSRSA